MTETNTLYDETTVYDILHTPGTAEELNGLERIARRFAPDTQQHPWLEPACGTARLLRLRAARNGRVIGVDHAPAMIGYARNVIARRNLARRAELHCADMTDFAPRLARPAGFAFNTINSIRHLHTDDGMLAHLDQMRAALLPGAPYAVGISTAAYGCEQPVEDVWHAARGPARVTQLVQYLPPNPPDRAERVISHITVTTPAAERHIDSTYTLRTYSAAEWFDLLERARFAVDAIVDEDGHDTEPAPAGYAVYVLRPLD